MTRRNGIIATAVTATAVIAAALIVTLAGGGGTDPHVDTRMDASDSLVPPYDFRKGYVRAGTICYSQDATDTTSKCFAANTLPYTTDATDVGWPVEPTQINRFPYNVSMSCDGTPFVCSTATMDSTSADPAGGTTASLITLGGGSLDATAFGFGNSVNLDFRIWATCDGTGTLDATHVGDVGHWTVDATAMGNGWRLLYPARAEVTEVQAFKSDSSGNLRLRLSGKGCTIWMPTATEATSVHHSTIPTTDATGSTVASPVWSVDNSTGAFWAASGVTKTETLTTHAGTCWNYSAPTIKLTGSSICTATWYALSLIWSY